MWEKDVYLFEYLINVFILISIFVKYLGIEKLII